MLQKSTVYDRRNYRVKNVEDAKRVSVNYLKDIDLDNAIQFGLPEVDDRYRIWRVPLKDKKCTRRSPLPKKLSPQSTSRRCL